MNRIPQVNGIDQNGNLDVEWKYGANGLTELEWLRWLDIIQEIAEERKKLRELEKGMREFKKPYEERNKNKQGAIRKVR